MGASGEDFVVTSKHSFRAASEMHFLCHEIGVAKHWNGTEATPGGIQVTHPISAIF